MIQYLRVRNPQTRGIVTLPRFGLNYLVGGLKLKTALFVPGSVNVINAPLVQVQIFNAPLKTINSLLASL